LLRRPRWRGTIKKIADGDQWAMPAAIDDPAILDEIGSALKGHGAAIMNCRNDVNELLE
jgi:hypothetical protein